MAANDYYQLINKQRLHGQDVINRYFYLHTEGTGDAITLNSAFFLSVIPQLIALQSAELQHTGLEAINLDNLEDFAETPLSTVGAVAGDSLPVFTAMNYRLAVNTRLFRPGSKRFAGVAETQSSDSTLISTTEAARQALGGALAGTISDGAGNVFRHVLVRKDENGLVIADANVTAASFTALTTQRSRKAGSGT